MEQIQLLDGFQDSYGGVTVEMKEHMDADVFAPLLRASIPSWKQQGKKGVLIKLPIEYSHLVDIIVKVLVVQEHSGRFQGTGVWKFPTGVVNEGEDISHAVVREVKEETGVDAKFVEVLCFGQSHESFFTKSDLFFLCVLHPESSAIEKQNVEIEAAKWMPIEDYAAQDFAFENEQFYYMAKICLARAGNGYPGFRPLATTTRSGKRSYIYCNTPEYLENYASFM